MLPQGALDWDSPCFLLHAGKVQGRAPASSYPLFDV